MNSSSPTHLPVSAATATYTPQPLPVQFNGDARSYFRVWLVNLLLTIVTLGIWSAWAQVRSRRWFLSHTLINGHAFDYHATGGQILLGKLLALATMLLYAGLSLVSLWVELALFIALMMTMPWAINASLSFHANMTSWSNVRFGFQGGYGRAVLVFLIMPIAALLSFGLLAPVYSRMAARYVAKGYSYGNTAFATAPRLGPLYAALGLSVLLLIAFFSTCVIAGGILGRLVSHALSLDALMGPDPSLELHRMGIFLPIMLTAYASFFIAALYYGACVRNEILNSMTITGGHRLERRLSPLRYVWVVASGLLATALTLTLAYPWARVRQYRYLTQSLTLLAAPALDAQVSRQQNAPGSFGSEFSQLQGFTGEALI